RSLDRSRPRQGSAQPANAPCEPGCWPNTHPKGAVSALRTRCAQLLHALPARFTAPAGDPIGEAIKEIRERSAFYRPAPRSRSKVERSTRVRGTRLASSSSTGRDGG